MTNLTERLEQAEAGTRDLSDEVLLACGWRIIEATPKQARHYVDPDDDSGEVLFARHWSDAPSPTESVDDALALVPEGWDYEAGGTKGGRAYAELWKPKGQGSLHRAATPALALCIAILRAHSKGGENG